MPGVPFASKIRTGPVAVLEGHATGLELRCTSVVFGPGPEALAGMRATARFTAPFAANFKPGPGRRCRARYLTRSSPSLLLWQAWPGGGGRGECYLTGAPLRPSLLSSGLARMPWQGVAIARGGFSAPFTADFDFKPGPRLVERRASIRSISAPPTSGRRRSPPTSGRRR